MRFLFTQPLGSRQIAKYYGCCDTMFVHVNHLGSTTMITNAAGTVMRDLVFYPYGQTWRNIGNNWDLHFASMWQREFASGLDPTPNRLYHSRLFRWMTPDEFTGGPTDAVSASVGGADPTPPGPLPYADITNPQSLNKYAYVYNNPLRYTDPTGRWCVFGKIGTTCTPPPPSIVKRPEVPMAGVNPVTGQILFRRDPKGVPGNERPGVGGAGNFGAPRGKSPDIRPHKGEDISGSVGDPIHASTGGTVTFSGAKGAYGYMVEINSGKGTVTRYAHNILNLVRTGDIVRQGDVIGMVGETGNAGSLPAPEAHSHFEVTRDGTPVDPAIWLNTAVTPP